MRRDRRTVFALGLGLGLLVNQMAWGTTQTNAVLQTRPSVTFNGYVAAEVASAFLATSGALYDTMPVTSQEMGWFFDFGDYGWVDGYFWTVSALHTRQLSTRRALFNEFETALCYGQTFKLAKDVAWHVKAGGLWDPPVGYEGAHDNVWGPYAVTRLDNPYLVPYVNGLWLVQPSMRTRIRVGVERAFSLRDDVTFTPMVETVWMDRRRFGSRYGDDPEHHDVFNGAFATIASGFTATWRFSEGWAAYLRFRQFDIVNSHARRAVKRRNVYYAKCDWPVFVLGLQRDF